MSPFSRQAKAHLARYKREHLGVTENGLWRGNKQPYEHILPESVLRLNILETIREDFWAYFDEQRASLELHRDFHHLNSSQAFAFNLFFPWTYTDTAREHLLSALGLSGEGIVRWSFEHIPDPAERTNFDFYAELTSGRRVFVEVKLTEEHFGVVVPRNEHRTKLENIYKPRLVGKARPESLNDTNFFLNYQLFRNLSHLDIGRGDLLFLLLPRANAFTWLQGEAFLNHLEHPASDCVRLVSAEDLYEALTKCASNVSPELCTYMDLLRAKYSFGGASTLDLEVDIE